MSGRARTAPEYALRAIGSLRQAEYNPRVISRRELEKLRGSIREFGFVEPMVVRRSDGTVLGGHQRLRAAVAEGFTEVPCVLVDCDDRQARLLNLALNKIGGSWDVPKLAELLAELSREESAELPTELSGFETDEVNRLLGVLADTDLPQASAEMAPNVTPNAAERQAVCPRCGQRFAAG